MGTSPNTLDKKPQTIVRNDLVLKERKSSYLNYFAVYQRGASLKIVDSSVLVY